MCQIDFIDVNTSDYTAKYYLNCSTTKFFEFEFVSKFRFIFNFQPFSMREALANQNCIAHFWQLALIKIIYKFKVWCRVRTHKIQRWVVVIRRDFTRLFHTFIIHSHCHSRQFCIRPIIHMHKVIMDIICCRFHRTTISTKIFIR